MKLPKKEYAHIVKHMPICCVDLVIQHKEKVLLIKRKDEPAKGEWSIIGGRVLKNETVEDAAKRKAKEEVGLDIKVIKKIGIYETFYKKSAFNCSTHTINIGFLVRAKNTAVKLDPTSEGFKWIIKSENNMHKYAKQLIKDSKLF